MSRNHSRPIAAVAAVETELLRRLCRDGMQSVPPDQLQGLALYSWSGTDHRVVFEALVRLANIPPAAFPHQLPAEAARMGFPDIEWAPFLEPPPKEWEPRRTTQELIAELLEPSPRTR